MSLYPTSRTKQLSADTFASPGPEFRGAPFWSWNCKLDRERLLRQIGWLDKMGLGGWHIHARTGLNTPYLGEEFMAHVKACVEAGRARGGLRTWLYDEDRWPSGAAGGIVTADPTLRARFLLLTTKKNEDATTLTTTTSQSVGGWSGCGRLLARYAVRLDQEGTLVSYRRLVSDETLAEPLANERSTGVPPVSHGRDAQATQSSARTSDGVPSATCERLWYAYLEVSQPSSWFNGQTYVHSIR